MGPGGRPLLAGRSVQRDGGPARRRRPPARPGRVPRGRLRRRSGCWPSWRRSPPRGEPYGRLHLLKSLAPLERSEAADPLALLRQRHALVRPRAPAAQPAALAHGARPGAARARRDGPGRHRRPPGAPAGALARRGGQHGRVVQPHGGRARGEPPRDRGVQPQPRGDGGGPHRGAARVRRRASCALKNHLATVIANVGTGVLSLDEDGRIETFNGRASRDPRPRPGGGARPHARGGARRGGDARGSCEAVAVVRDRRQDVARGPGRVRAAARAAARSPSWPLSCAARRSGRSAPSW